MNISQRIRQSLTMTLLEALPHKLQTEMLDDGRFRRWSGLGMQVVLTIGKDLATLDRSTFFRAVREAHAKRGCSGEINDDKGRSWQLSIEEQAGMTYTALRRGKQTALLPSFFGLDRNSERRLAAFLAEARAVNLPVQRMKHWQRILRRRALEDEEIGELDADIAENPVRLLRSIADDVETGFSKIKSLVPSEPAYIDRLIGQSLAAEAIEEYAQGAIVEHVSQLVGWDAWQGAQLALLLAGHGSVMSAIPEETLAKIDIPALADWALEHGDPISQLGMVEIGVRWLARQPEIETTLVAIVERLLADDPADDSGRLALLSATFIFADGELGRAPVFRRGRPFRRRLASLAQASMIHRQVWGMVDTARFSSWAKEQRAYAFFCRTLVDLREEPRWMPGFASAEQFGHEVLGRLASLPGMRAGGLPAGPLLDILTKDGEGTLKGRLSLMALWPGPLEGRQRSPANPLPAGIGDIIVESLSAPGLEPKAFFALVNARGFALDANLIDLAIRSLQEAKYRLKEDPDEASPIYFGLASVAAAERRPDLAQELRILMRRGRRDHRQPLAEIDELRVAITAAAAHENLDDWSNFAGNWALELATSDISGEKARHLLTEIDHIIRFAPELARDMARARATLSAVIDL